MADLASLMGHTLCNKSLFEFSVYPFNILQVCYRHNEDEHEEDQC